MMTARKERFGAWAPPPFGGGATATLTTDGWEAIVTAVNDGANWWTLTVCRRSLSGDKAHPWIVATVKAYSFPKTRAALARRLPYPTLRVAVSALRMPPCA